MLSLNWCVGQDTSVEIFDGCLGMAQNKMAKPSRLSRQALYSSLKEVRKLRLNVLSSRFVIRVNLLHP